MGIPAGILISGWTPTQIGYAKHRWNRIGKAGRAIEPTIDGLRELQAWYLTLYGAPPDIARLKALTGLTDIDGFCDETYTNALIGNIGPLLA